MEDKLHEKLQQVVTDIDKRQAELVALLDRLVSFPTVSPPARNTLEAQQFLASLLQQIGFQTDLWEVYPNDPNLVGVHRGTDSAHYRSLIINGHIDVAEVGDDHEWSVSPFRVTRQGERLLGRGVSDMKAGLAGALFAIQLLKEHGVEWKGDLTFQSVIGEEAGEAGTQSCVERGYTADLALVVDTSELHIQGQGGVITGWIVIESPQTFHDGIRSKMIHAGGKVYGANAIEKMMKVIASLQELERHFAVTKSYPGFPAGMNTINPAVIEGGRHAAFVADRCALWITVHFYPDEDYQQVVQEIEAHVLAAAKADPWLRNNLPKFRWGGKSMIEERGEIFPSLALDPEQAGVQMLAEMHRSVQGTTPIIDMSGTVTDAGWLGRAGIETMIYGPGDLKNAHAVDESIALSELLDFSKVMAKMIAHWCNTRK